MVKIPLIHVRNLRDIQINISGQNVTSKTPCLISLTLISQSIEILVPLNRMSCFFDDNLCDILSTGIQRYALFQNEVDPLVTKDEIKCFLSVLILPGYNKLPGKRFYWDSATDMQNEMVHAAISKIGLFKL